MIPRRTREALGLSLHQANRLDPKASYVVEGYALNELAALAMRLNDRMDGDEQRDWQNRLNLMIDSASKL